MLAGRGGIDKTGIKIGIVKIGIAKIGLKVGEQEKIRVILQDSVHDR